MSAAEPTTSSSPAPSRDPVTRALLIIMTVFVMATALYLSQVVVIPIVAAILLNLLLKPVVRRLERVGVRPVFTAAVVVAISAVVLTGAGYVVWDAIAEWIGDTEQTAARIEQRLAELRKPVDQLTEVADRIEKISIDGGGAVAAVRVEPQGFIPSFVDQSMVVLGSFFIVAFLTFFLLATGDGFLRQSVQLFPRFNHQKNLVAVIRAIEDSMFRFILLRTAINIGLGIAAYGIFLAFDLPNAHFWAITGAVLNYVPYVGPGMTALFVGAASLMAFDQPSRAFLVPGCWIALNIVEGFIVSPLVIGRGLDLNPVAVFVSLVFWGWLWGIVGAFIAVPLLIVIYVVCREVPSLARYGKLLGRLPTRVNGRGGEAPPSAADPGRPSAGADAAAAAHADADAIATKRPPVRARPHVQPRPAT